MPIKEISLKKVKKLIRKKNDKYTAGKSADYAAGYDDGYWRCVEDLDEQRVFHIANAAIAEQERRFCDGGGLKGKSPVDSDGGLDKADSSP